MSSTAITSISPDQILQLPPSVLAVLPAGLPPTGVTPDFEHPKTIQPLVIGITSTSIALCTICFGLRCYNKIFVVRKLWWDDLTCLLAYLCTITLWSGIMLAVLDGPLGKHMYEIHLSDLFSNAWLVGGTFITTTFILPALLFLKATFFLLYYTIFKPFQWMRWFCIIGGILSTAFYGAASIVQFYFASPKNGESFAEYDLGGDVYKLSILSIPTSVVGLGIDVLLFIMPLIAVSRLNMPSKRKISTSLLFAIGSLAVLGATLSLYYRTLESFNYSDVSWVSAPSSFVSIIECAFGLIVVCMPSVLKIAQHHKIDSFAMSLLSRFARLTQANKFSNGRSSWRSKSYGKTKGDTYASSQRSMHKKHTTLNSSSDIELVEQADGGQQTETYESSSAEASDWILRTVGVHQYDETRTGTLQKPEGHF